MRRKHQENGAWMPLETERRIFQTSQITSEIVENASKPQTSHDSDSERLTKVASRNHSIYNHFPKDPICEFCKRTKIASSLQKGEIFRFPIAGGTTTFSGRDHEVRESTVRRDHPVMSQDLRDALQGNSERSQPTETRDDAGVRKDFWSIQGDLI